jgi:hypothetical protein
MFTTWILHIIAIFVVPFIYFIHFFYSRRNARTFTYSKMKARDDESLHSPTDSDVSSVYSVEAVASQSVLTKQCSIITKISVKPIFPFCSSSSSSLRSQSSSAKISRTSRSRPHHANLLLLSMVRLHQLLSRTLASHQILPSATSSVRSTPRLLLPLRLPPPAPPPHGRTLLPIIVAASRQYASSTFGRRGRSTRPPMLLRRKRARSPTRKGPGELRVQIGIEEALPDDPGILVIASGP